jgi:hypothetical protein
VVRRRGDPRSGKCWTRGIAQGDPWAAKSTHVGACRGPFKSWEDAAVDALVNCAPFAARNKDWSIGGILTLLAIVISQASWAASSRHQTLIPIRSVSVRPLHVGSGLDMICGFPIPREQFVQTVDGMSADHDGTSRRGVGSTSLSLQVSIKERTTAQRCLAAIGRRREYCNHHFERGTSVVEVSGADRHGIAERRATARCAEPSLLSMSLCATRSLT